MLQGGAYLELEAVVLEFGVCGLAQSADIVQGVVAEAVVLVLLTLVLGVLPVNVEQLFGQRRYTIDLLVVERDDADAENVGNVLKLSVFIPLSFEFAYK